jgi:hypothetical protein
MKGFVQRIALVASMLALSLSAHAKDALTELQGTWKIQSIIGSGAASSMSDREARKMIGKTLKVEARRFTLNGQPCRDTKYEETTEATAGHFEREWNTTVKDIPLPDPVTAIDTGCATLYPLKNGKLMVAEKGVFFEAARLKKSRGH